MSGDYENGFCTKCGWSWGMCLCRDSRAKLQRATDDQLQPVDGTEAGDRLATPAPMARQLDAAIADFKKQSRRCEDAANREAMEFGYRLAYELGIEATIWSRAAYRLERIKANQVEGEARET